MKILEKKALEKTEKKEKGYILLVSDDSERRFNIAKTSEKIDLANADYFFPIMVSEKTAMEEYKKY